jgi:uncharacterized protein (DUF1501 family)
MAGTRITRRRFLTGTAALAAIPTFAPLTGRVGQAFGLTAAEAAGAERNRLVVIFLGGGNDGLNTVIPMADADGTQRLSVYRQVRPTIRYEPAEVLPLDLAGDAPHGLGLHPSLSNLHAMYENGRVAIVQGVDYPSHSFSHFEGTDFWESGQPEIAPDSGWLGRHLDRVGIGAGELRAVAIGSELPLIFRGRDKQGVSIPGIPLQFADGTAALGDARHDALEQFALHSAGEPLRQFEGQMMDATVDLTRQLELVSAPPVTGNALTNALLTARVLLEGDFGLECVFVSVGGYDTHVGQKPLHQNLMASLDTAISTFLDGDASLGIAPMAPAVAAQTLVMTFSEFGRRLGENGSAGTDHGTASPLFIVGPAGGRLVPGLHGDHPALGTTLAPLDNVTATTDFRSVYQAVLQEWLADPEPTYGDPLPGLFTPPPPPAP